jgi:RNA polymerase sigma-70 factor, ECF subfamily
LDRDAVSDERLLERFVSGDRRSFDELVRRHEDRIFAVALRITGNRADALDATQNTFIALFRRAGSFRGDARVSTWLYSIATNACRDVLRANRRAPEPSDELTAVEEIADVERAASVRVDVARALHALPHEYREAVVLHDLGGVPYDEIAALTGVPLGTVKSRISRGRAQLGRLLEHTVEATPSKEER